MTKETDRHPFDESRVADLGKLRSLLRELAAWKIHHHCCGETDFDPQWHEQIALINDLAGRVTAEVDLQSEASRLYRSLDSLDKVISIVDEAIDQSTDRPPDIT